MKKYSSILLVVMMMFFSCSEDFLQEKPVTTLTQDYYKTVEGLESLVKGSYQILRFKSDYNQGNYLFGIGSDVEVFSWSNADRIAMGGYNPDGWGPQLSGTRIAPLTNSLIGQVSGGVSEGVYPEIIRCNIFFENFAKLSEADQKRLVARRGEALFLRSYSYYLITNVLGDAPLILSSFAGMPSNFAFEKEKMEVIYKQIIGDMRQAVDILPETTSELGRITKPAAAHLLAKMYLNRAQAAEFQNSAEPTLKALYKGNVTTDLDSAIHYATVAINIIAQQNNNAYGGLSPDYASLWLNDTKYTRDAQKEILLSAQYEPTITYNGRYGNTLVHLFNSNHTSLRACTPRTLDYGRPYATAGPSDWGFDMFTDRANDSRYYKTYLTDYVATDATLKGGKPWDKPTAYYYNNYLKPAADPAVTVSSVSKIKYQQRSIVYIENAKDEPLDSLWVVSQPYIMMVRWMVGSPNSAGYFNADGTPKTGAMIDPKNPVVTNTSGRKLMYRISGDKGEPFGLDRGLAVAQWYMSPRKWLDIYRGKGTDPNGSGSIDIPLFRLPETYLVRAEAYGRKGDYTSAINDINVLRKRAAYHVGEKRSDVLVKLEPAVITGRLDIPVAEKNAPYSVATDSYEKIKVDGTEWQPGSAKSRLENYPKEATTADKQFIHFIYNERAREFAFELINVEDLHNAGILYERIRDRDMMGAPASSTGTVDFPFPKDDISTNLGALGTGKGALNRMHTFKPWPQVYLDLLTDQNNQPLTDDAKKAYQNYGY